MACSHKIQMATVWISFGHTLKHLIWESWMMHYRHIYTAFCIIIKLKVMFWKLYTRIYFNVGTLSIKLQYIYYTDGLQSLPLPCPSCPASSVGWVWTHGGIRGTWHLVSSVVNTSCLFKYLSSKCADQAAIMKHVTARWQSHEHWWLQRQPVP